MTNSIELGSFFSGETIETPAGHKLSFLGYSNESRLYELLIVRNGGARIEGWMTAAQACGRADAMNRRAA